MPMLVARPLCQVKRLEAMDSVFGYVASALIGLSLGLVGGGGSIITVPVLVYLFHISPLIATTYSLFIVGTTSLVGGVQGLVEHTVDLRKAILFSIPSTIAVYVMRHHILWRIPEQIFTTASLVVTRDFAIMLFFALMMILASVRMIRPRDDAPAVGTDRGDAQIILLALVVGLVTGFVGAGGGFLIIPSLVLFTGLPMKKATATSLVVIAINSLIGFASDVNVAQQDFQLSFAMLLSAVAVGGVLVGHWMSKYINASRLRAGFGWFTLIIALFILVKEVLM
jgi:uncharacterized membrane protein YfcA